MSLSISPRRIKKGLKSSMVKAFESSDVHPRHAYCYMGISGTPHYREELIAKIPALSEVFRLYFVAIMREKVTLTPKEGGTNPISFIIPGVQNSLKLACLCDFSLPEEAPPENESSHPFTSRLGRILKGEWDLRKESKLYRNFGDEWLIIVPSGDTIYVSAQYKKRDVSTGEETKVSKSIQVFCGGKDTQESLRYNYNGTYGEPQEHLQHEIHELLVHFGL